MNLPYCGILLGTLTMALVCAGTKASPVASEKKDFTYQEHDDFKREIREKIEDLHKNNKRAVFDRILAVNDIHKRWSAKDRLEKRNLDPDNTIIKINTEDDNQLFEGDIAMSSDDKLEIEKTASFRRKRNAIQQRKAIWRTRRIPYIIDSGLSSEAVSSIQKASAIIHEKTCVRWVQLKVEDALKEKNYVHFKKGNGCFSTLGRDYSRRGAQTLSIGQGCEWLPIVLHEMTHCMGFYHEQSRNDRNLYIKILWENIPKNLHDQFEKYSHGQIDKMNIDYDFRSIMHYSSTAFGNGTTTIAPIDPTQTVGDAETYTALDIVEINALYDCKTSATSKVSSWSSWSECDPRYCDRQRQRFCFSTKKTDCPPKTNVYGIETEYKVCSQLECKGPVDGNWGMWSSWGACSRKCDEGKRTRTRYCNNPAPRNGGKPCVGEITDVSTCLERRCNSGGRYDSDFESGWGIWSSASNTGLLPWIRHSSFTKTMNTGPRGDHTLQGKGNYIYVESSNRKKGDKALLVSQTLEFTTPHCLSFYYSMYGELTGTLTLYLVPEGETGKKIYLFAKIGNKGTSWFNADVTLAHIGKFKLIFEDELGGTGYSDTALDDIFIDKGACPGYTCQDNNEGCASWAQSGECDKNPAFMHIDCPLSCRLCGEPEKCEDKHTSCYFWSTIRQCQGNPAFMHTQCKASCGLCGDCKDITNKAQCAAWEQQGYCSKSAAYMMANCKQSCTGCQLPCLDGNSECPGWAKGGECEKNPNWMGENCRKSCKKC